MSDVFLDYRLPTHLIAQEPCARRDDARLMVLRRHDQSITHQRFRDLPELLRPNDLLVLNNTRVLHARLLGKRAKTGGKWEGLFLRVNPDETWQMMCQTRGRLLPGETILVEPGPLQLKLIEKSAGGQWKVQPNMTGSVSDVLSQHGHVPLPPYIRKGRAEKSDEDRYQTVFATQYGAVAAPTAGLHFTPDVLRSLEQRGVRKSLVTLHVGLGTFQPLQDDDYLRHMMHSEWGELSEETASAIRECSAQNGRVVAVGTTSVRVLETVAATGDIRPWTGETNLYIHPPYEFRAVDALITNFHLPRTTLLLLVGAFAGCFFLRKAYEIAVAEEYRFFSYGDAMLIL